MSDKNDYSNHLTPEFTWMVFSPEHGETYCRTEAAALLLADSHIQDYLDDVWDEGVTNVLIARVTHTVKQTNLIKRPDDSELDENGNDEDGGNWSGDCDYKCNYEINPLGQMDAMDVLRAERDQMLEALRLAFRTPFDDWYSKSVNVAIFECIKKYEDEVQS